MPMALLATQGVLYGLIGNPMGPIARWRAALVRPAPRQSAPGAMVGQVCALGAVSGDLSALWRHLPLFSVRLALFRGLYRCGVSILLRPRRQRNYKVFLTFNFNQNSFVFGSTCFGTWRSSQVCSP